MALSSMAFVYAPDVEDCPYPPECPFKTERTGLTRQRLLSFGILGGSPESIEVPARPATRDELLRFHTEAYLDGMQRTAALLATIAKVQRHVFPHHGLAQPGSG